MEESNNITLELGNVSLSQELGPYYIDMRPAMIHYNENIYGVGGLDKDGIYKLDTPGGDVYYPV